MICVCVPPRERWNEEKEHIIKTHTIIESKELLNDLSNKLLEHKKTLVTSAETQIKYHISTVIIDKLKKTIDELLNNEKDLHRYVSTLRYTLETLIISKIINKRA